MTCKGVIFSRVGTYIACSFVLLTTLGLSECNMTRGVDGEDESAQFLAAAKTKLDAGECSAAINDINRITSPSEDAARVKGWAYLCLAGATLEKVGKNAFSYNSSEDNINVVGNLANGILPQSSSQIENISEAIRTFETMGTGKARAINLGLAQLVKAAAVIAKNKSAAGAKVVKTDIAHPDCVSANPCATQSGVCVAGADGRMNNADATMVRQAVVDAQNAIAGQSDLGEAATLINSISSTLTTTATDDFTRCYIVTRMLSE